MGDSSQGAFAILSQLIFYVSLIVQIGIAVLAFVRFKTKLSGLLIGGAFAAGVVLQILFKLVFAILKAAGPSSDALTALVVIKGLLLLLCSLVVAVGVVLIPSSLEKLSKPTGA